MSRYDYGQREAAFASQAKSVLIDCKAKRDSGQLRGSVALVNCSNSRLADLWNWYQLGLDDLAALFLARRLEIAERVDQAAITEGQGQVEVLQAYQQYDPVANQLQQMQHIMGAQQRGGWGAW